MNNENYKELANNLTDEVVDLRIDNEKLKKANKELTQQLLKINSSNRSCFYKQLDKMCEHYIEKTEKEDEDKWYDNTMADKVKFWCKWIRVFAKENGY